MFSEHVQKEGGIRAAARADTRRRVLAAADESFRERGYAATTIRDIAARAQVSVGTVMNVGEKDALLIAIVDEWIAAVHAARAAAPARSAARSPTTAQVVTRIGEIVGPFIAYFDADGDLSREYAAVLARGRHTSRVFGDLAQALIREFTEVMAAAGRPDPAAAARTLYYVYIGMLFATSGGALDQQSARDRLVEAIHQILGEEVER
ncbi:TetR/AcrR family transcriptional regulator [Tsukamurella soli]|uniref:HTH tetR-type domain-containing protein n=1 Tax=Tsukamurella soli TaxID=644556 RepID=A0ABP8K6G3_9ACTN